jgi:4-oxalocrotonate tautomerase
MIQITLASGRTVELKKALFKTIAEFLAKEQGFRKEDVFINLVETSRENWSFGNGIAQYADSPPPHLGK